MIAVGTYILLVVGAIKVATTITRWHRAIAHGLRALLANRPTPVSAADPWRRNHGRATRKVNRRVINAVIPTDPMDRARTLWYADKVWRDHANEGSAGSK